jgi:threonylcarbamoyladenosine tRNA methylthiotransferase MtaB
MVGFSANYVKAERPYEKDLVNKIEVVTLGDWNEDRSAITIK